MDWKELNIEDCLFRYRSFDKEGRNIDALKNGRLYFSSPMWFNDPYDSLVFAKADKIWGEMCLSFYYGMDQYIESVKKKYPEEAFVAYHFWNTDKEKALQLTYDDFHKSLKLVRNQIRRNTKVICFSESYDSMLMWAHYADYHKGFALMYTKEEIRNGGVYSKDGKRIGDNVRIDPVEYVEKQQDLTNDVGWYVRENVMRKDSSFIPSDRSVGITKVRRVLLEKAKEWSYEKEWRVTERRPEFIRESKASYIDCCPKAILVGSQCEQGNHELLISISKELRIPIFRMYLSENENGFILRPGKGNPYYCF